MLIDKARDKYSKAAFQNMHQADAGGMGHASRDGYGSNWRVTLFLEHGLGLIGIEKKENYCLLFANSFATYR
jgi:hypothetical protein